MNRKRLTLIIASIILVAVGAVMVAASYKEKKGQKIRPVSKTEIVATITYDHKTDKDNSIYYRILKTTYYDAGAPSAVTGLNTDALNILFPVEHMDSCEEMMVRDRRGALYRKNDTAFLCWTYDSEVTYVLEYSPDKIPDYEILKMAESAKPAD